MENTNQPTLPYKLYTFDSDYNGTALQKGDIVEFIRYVPRSTKCYQGCPERKRKPTNYRGWWEVKRLEDDLIQRVMRKHLTSHSP
jgi:hypothetical protein